MTASRSLFFHLLRGLIGLLGLVVSISGRLPVWADFILILGSLIALRGCPMCWFIRLLKTIRPQAVSAQSPGSRKIRAELIPNHS